MYIYAQVGSNGKVHTIAELPNRMIEIQNDERLLGTRYDETTGKFIGFKILLTADKTYIVADGTDAATITATIRTWDDLPGIDFADDITFETNGQAVTAAVTNGQATLEFVASEPGTYEIKTANDGDVIQNGSVEIKVTEVSE